MACPSLGMVLQFRARVGRGGAADHLLPKSLPFPFSKLKVDFFHKVKENQTKIPNNKTKPATRHVSSLHLRSWSMLRACQPPMVFNWCPLSTSVAVAGKLQDCCFPKFSFFSPTFWNVSAPCDKKLYLRQKTLLRGSTKTWLCQQWELLCP